MVAAGLIAVLGASMLWRERLQLGRLKAALPAMPAVSTQAAAFGVALRQAEQRARTARPTLEDVQELGRLYHANGYSREAEACWRIMRAAQPREARWCYYLADLRRTASDDPGMIAFLNDTLKLAPDYAPAWLKLAEWEFKTGQVDAAERDYRRRLALLPRDPYARLGLARLARQRGRQDDSRRWIEEIVRDTPAFSAAHNLYAEMLVEGGDAAAANKQRFLGRLAGRFREADDPWLEELRAWCYDPSRLAMWASIDDMTNHGDHGAALLERAITIVPDDARGYDELGRVYLHRGDAAKARTLFEQGSKLPNAPSSLFAGLGEAYRALNEPEEAVQATERGLALQPDAADLLTAHGIALQAAGRTEEAVAAFCLAVERAPNVCETHFNLGSALLQLGRKDEAVAALKRALELEPLYPRALIVLGQSELEAGRLDSAERYLRPLYEYYPGSVSAQRLMTWWCLQSGIAADRAGRTAEAERHLRDGLVINPDSPELRARLGLLYGQARRFAEALEQFEAYHRLRPNEPMASLFLGQASARLGRNDDARRLFTEGGQLARQAGDTATAAACTEELRRLNP